MGETADAVVVGGGLNGAATAYFLVQQGFRRVVVLDSDRPAAGASGAAVGLLRCHYDNRPETELATRSMPYFRDWGERIGGSCGWRRTGFFRFVEEEEVANMHRNVAVQREFGERADILMPDEVGRIAPEFRSGDFGAVVHEPDSGTASNSLATCTLLKRACERGAIVQPWTTALRILTDGGRAIGVATNRHEIASPVVVLAAGAACKPLAASCGIDLPLEKRPIRVAEILPPEGLRLPGAYMDPITDSWISPREQGRALISVPKPPADAAAVSDDGAADFARKHASFGLPAVARRLPGIAGAAIVRFWTRPDSYAPDGKPIIGSVPEIEGLFLNTAGAGKGHKTAPAAGLALSELIAEGEARSADLAPFGLARFRAPPRPWSDSEYSKRVIG